MKLPRQQDGFRIVAELGSGSGKKTRHMLKALARKDERAACIVQSTFQVPRSTHASGNSATSAK